MKNLKDSIIEARKSLKEDSSLAASPLAALLLKNGATISEPKSAGKEGKGKWWKGSGDTLILNVDKMKSSIAMEDFMELLDDMNTLPIHDVIPHEFHIEKFPDGKFARLWWD